MSEIESIIEELENVHDGNAWYGASLAEALDGISHDQAAARSIEQAHSIWEIVAHIEAWEDVFLRRLEGQEASEPEAGDFPAPAGQNENAWAETLEKLENTHRRLLSAIEKMPDSILETNVTGRDYSHRFLLRKTLEHKVYHTGQIALLRKALT